MSANANPMFTRVGSVQGGVTLTTAAADYTGQGILNYLVFQADPSNGSFVQKLRFKSLGTNVASVARIRLNMGTHAHGHTERRCGKPGGWQLLCQDPGGGPVGWGQRDVQ